MKKTLFAVLLAAISISANGHMKGSEFTLRIHDHGLYSVSLDRIAHPVSGEGQFNFTELRPGRHFLRVDEIWGRKGRHRKPVFSGHVDIPAGSKVVAAINRFGQFSIRKVIALQHPAHTPSGLSAPAFGCSSQPVVPEHMPAPCIMDPHEFDILVSTIECRFSDNSRMYIALHAIENNFFTTEQVAVLMRLMTFESSKLEIAKAAYSRTVDNHIYFALFDEFTFDSSIRYLTEYMSQG